MRGRRAIVTTTAVLASAGLAGVGPIAGAAPGHDPADPIIRDGDLLVSNHSFEDGTAGWTPSNGQGGPASPHCRDAGAATGTWASDGQAGLEFTGEAPCVNAGAVAEPVTAEPGETYTAFVRTDGPGQASLGLRFLDDAGDVLADEHAPRTDAGDVLEVTATAPEGASAVAVELGAHRTVRFDEALITAPLTATGDQVTKRGSFLAMAAGHDENGRAVTFSVATGSDDDPGTLVVTDVLTGEITRTVPLPGVTGSWTLEQNPVTDEVYIGAYGAPGLYSWTPGQDEAELLGLPPIDRIGMLYGLTSAPDGTLYGGAWGEPTDGYDGAQLWRYTAADGFESFGPVLTEDANYTRAVAYEPENEALWAGTGTVPHLYGCDTDGTCTDFTDLLNEDIRSKEWVYGMTAGSGYVQVWAGDSKSFGDDYLLVLRTWRDDAGDLQAEVAHEVPGVIYNGSSPVVDGKVYYSVAGEENQPLHSLDVETGEEVVLDHAETGIFSRAWEVMDLDDPAWPGPSLVGFNSGGYLVKYNIETEALERTYVEDVPEVASGLSSAVGGADGRIWSAGYLTGGLGAYSPMRADRQVTYEVGRQAEGMISHDGAVYQGTYPNGQIASFDPRTFDGSAEPDVECTIGAEQNRPYGLAAVGQQLYYGSQAAYGHDLGAIGYLDLETGTCTTFSEEVGHYSVNTLTPAAGKIVGGTSIFFSYDGTPIEDEAGLVVLDESDRITHHDLPVRGLRAVSAVATSADGLVWAYAEGWLFGFDAETEEWVFQEEVFPGWKPGQRISGNYAAMLELDGVLYGNAGGRLFALDPAATLESGTAEVTVLLASGAGGGLTTDDYGNLYTRYQSTQLLRINPRAL